MFQRESGGSRRQHRGETECSLQVQPLRAWRLGTWQAKYGEGASDQLVRRTRLWLRTCLPCMSLMARIDFSGDSKRSRPAHRLMPVLGSDRIRQDVTGPNACKAAAA